MQIICVQPTNLGEATSMEERELTNTNSFIFFLNNLQILYTKRIKRIKNITCLAAIEFLSQNLDQARFKEKEKTVSISNYYWLQQARTCKTEKRKRYLEHLDHGKKETISQLGQWLTTMDTSTMVKQWL